MKGFMEDRETKEERYRYLVGISGESGSGKSELAHALGKMPEGQPHQGQGDPYG